MSDSFLDAASSRAQEAVQTPEPPIDLTAMIASSTEHIDKPDLDERAYRYLKLNNELQVMLVSDPNCDHGAACCEVGVGSASDPEELPGLAHFLEHMLFLGTEKYPAEDAYQGYLEQHGGSSNAFTSHENTTYFFDVQHPFLRGALDRFAQFFLCPLFTESATGREMKAVDSENSKNQQSDAWRLQQLNKWAADPRHPWSKFNVGSLDTLTDKPEKRVRLDLRLTASSAGVAVRADLRAAHTPALHVRKALIDFHAAHYSANLMTLAVLGREPIDTLAQWVVPLFADVPNKQLPLPCWPHPPYPAERLGRHFKVVPVKDFSSLTVSWPIPPIRAQYLSKPFRYVSHLLGHETEGSLLSLLKEHGWADQLVAGESRSHSDFATFDVTMELTEAADEHVEEIVTLVFSCLAMIRAKPAARWVFDEMRDLAQVGFRFKDVVEPQNAVLSLASAMQHHPAQHAMSHPYLFEEWRADQVDALLTLLSVERASITHTSRAHEGVATMREPWYGTAFTVAPISGALLDKWRAVEAHPSLAWPEPNPFIPTDFALACDATDGDAEHCAEAPQQPSGEAGLAVVPSLIRDDRIARLWHKCDSTFRRPKTNLFMEIVAPSAYATPEAACLTRLFFRLVTDELTEFAYPAECAGLNYMVYNSTSGLRLAVAGYNHKLPVLLERVLARMAQPTLDAERFAVQRDLQLKEYQNFFKGAPYSHARYAASHMLELSRWHILEYVDFMGDAEECTHAALTSFARGSLLRKIHFNVLSHGNTSRPAAAQLIDAAASALGAKPLAPSQLPTPRLLMLPETADVYLRLHPSLYAPEHQPLLNPDERNSAIELTLQAGIDRRPDTIVVELLAQVLAHPAYERLRTIEQLGYIANLGFRCDLGVTGLRVIVQSATRDAAYLDERIEAFFDGVPALLLGLSASEFANHKESLLKAKLELPKTLRHESNVYWSEISAATYDFQRDARDAEVLRTLTLDDLSQYWQATFHASAPRRRKLSSQVFAAHHPLPPKQTRGTGGRPIHYVDGLEQVIEYKRTLAAFPAPARVEQPGTS